MLFRNSKNTGEEKVVLKPKKETDVFSILKKTSTKAKSAPRKKVNLKEVILEEIVNNNIWTDEDLDALFSRTKETYSDMSDLEVQDAIDYVKSIIL